MYCGCDWSGNPVQSADLKYMGLYVTNKLGMLMLEWQCFSVLSGATRSSLHILLIYFVLK
jgi:hypothetical protein